MSEISINYLTKNVKLIFEKDIINAEWRFLDRSRHYFVITDTNIANLYEDILSLIPNLKSILVIKAGEKAKSIHVYKKIIKSLIKFKISKDDTLIVFGGGVINDLASFVASTYLGGIDYVLIPTTLVAQVSAALSERCYLDIDVKNAISVISHPLAIIIDPTILKTLSQSEFEDGIAEIIKYGMIKDKTILQEISDHKITINTINFYYLLEKCINIKIALETNPKDKNLANFGLLYGKIIRQLSTNELSYGRLLAIGMYYELQNEELRFELKSILKLYNLDTYLPKWNINYQKYIAKQNTSYETIEIKSMGNAELVFHQN